MPIDEMSRLKVQTHLRNETTDHNRKGASYLFFIGERLTRIHDPRRKHERWANHLISGRHPHFLHNAINQQLMLNYCKLLNYWWTTPHSFFLPARVCFWVPTTSTVYLSGAIRVKPKGHQAQERHGFTFRRNVRCFSLLYDAMIVWPIGQ